MKFRNLVYSLSFATSLLGVTATAQAETGCNMPEQVAIYQDIWNADQTGNGVPALRPGEATNDAAGYVIVDERATDVGAQHRVLKDVVVPDAKRTTYDLCEKIFDNYALERAATEVIRPEETQEELAFIDAEPVCRALFLRNPSPE